MRNNEQNEGKRMKVIAILIIVIGLSACGSKKETKRPDSEPKLSILDKEEDKASTTSFITEDTDSSGAWWMDESATEYDLGLVDGKRSAKRIQRYPSGEKRYETPLLDGKPHGLAKAWYASGALEMVIPFVEGKRHGMTVGWYESGQKAFETPYVNGVAHGTGYWWYETGDLQYETPFVNGKQDGIQKIWKEDGSKKEVIWEKGVEK